MLLTPNTEFHRPKLYTACWVRLYGRESVTASQGPRRWIPDGCVTFINRLCVYSQYKLRTKHNLRFHPLWIPPHFCIFLERDQSLFCSQAIYRFLLHVLKMTRKWGRSVDCNQAGFVTKQEEIPTHSCFERFSVCHLIFPHLYFDLVVLCICQEHWLKRSICIIKNILKR